MLLLKVSQSTIRSSCEQERELESDIATIFRTTELSDGASEPDLSHAENCTHHTKCEGKNGCESGWQLVLAKVVLWLIAREATLEEEVLSQRDTLVDCEPVSNQQHEVLKDRFEVAVTWDGDRAVHECTDKGPDESGNTLRLASEELERERDGVDVGAVVGDDGESEDDEAELAEFAQW